MSQSQSSTGSDSELPIVEQADVDPEKWLSASQVSLLEARIAQLDDMVSIRAFVAYERTHRNRMGVLRWLKNRAAKVRKS